MQFLNQVSTDLYLPIQGKHFDSHGLKSKTTRTNLNSKDSFEMGSGRQNDLNQAKNTQKSPPPVDVKIEQPTFTVSDNQPQTTASGQDFKRRRKSNHESSGYINEFEVSCLL